jgi:hypothetical protein
LENDTHRPFAPACLVPSDADIEALTAESALLALLRESAPDAAHATEPVLLNLPSYASFERRGFADVLPHRISHPLQTLRQMAGRRRAGVAAWACVGWTTIRGGEGMGRDRSPVALPSCQRASAMAFWRACRKVHSRIQADLTLGQIGRALKVILPSPPSCAMPAAVQTALLYLHEQESHAGARFVDIAAMTLRLHPEEKSAICQPRLSTLADHYARREPDSRRDLLRGNRPARSPRA